MVRRTPPLAKFIAPRLPLRSAGQRARADKARWLAVVAVVTLTLLGPQAVGAARPATRPHSISGPSLTPSLPSPQPVGTPITWTAAATDSVPLVFQFNVGPTSTGPWTMKRDFSPHNSVVLAPLAAGPYYVQVVAKEGYTGTVTASSVAAFAQTSRVSGGQPVVSATANPLVALYSAPGCPAGAQMVVEFRPVGAPLWKATNVASCQGAGVSRNFLVAGMLPNATYQLVNVTFGAGRPVTSSALLFTTGAPPVGLTFPKITVPQPSGSQSALGDNEIFHALQETQPNVANPVATNLAGQIVWYADESDLSSVSTVRIQPVGGSVGTTVRLLANDGLQPLGNDVIREIDLAGNPIQETNVQAINAQLTARGDEIIYSFNHDIYTLPNGYTAVLGNTQQVITTTPIMGDMLIVLDKNWQVSWTWDAFKFLNPFRGPTLGDVCGPGCPVPGGPGTIDWTHTNAIDYSPADGDLLLSIRDQDWVVKLNYANGTGDGSIVWRLGRQGDFRIVPLTQSDPYPWFSHQHDANYLDGTTLTLFDNGNTRCATLPPPCDSRGQVYTIDEQSRVVTQTVNADMGTYSSYLGTAQRLSNGNYNFTSGFVTFPPPPYAQDVEMLPDGAKVFVQQLNTNEYRAWRLPTLYSQTNLPCPSCSPGA